MIQAWRWSEKKSCFPLAVPLILKKWYMVVRNKKVRKVYVEDMKVMVSRDETNCG